MAPSAPLDLLLRAYQGGTHTWGACVPGGVCVQGGWGVHAQGGMGAKGGACVPGACPPVDRILDTRL